MRTIRPCLWFDDQAEEAVNFYLSLFENSRIVAITPYSDANEHGKAGSAMTITFELNGQPFMAINGGPHFKFNEAISMFVPCDTQDEIDHFWYKLSVDGEKSQCGWLKDKYGVWWQIAPAMLDAMLRDPDIQKVNSVTRVLLNQRKLDIAVLQDAFDNP
jgi:predicted 3-demethylubiquinone-9 3-methyltransferase (glyoxalase superfamily)